MFAFCGSRRWDETLVPQDRLLSHAVLKTHEQSSDVLEYFGLALVHLLYAFGIIRHELDGFVRELRIKVFWLQIIEQMESVKNHPCGIDVSGADELHFYSAARDILLKKR